MDISIFGDNHQTKGLESTLLLPWLSLPVGIGSVGKLQFMGTLLTAWWKSWRLKLCPGL